MAVLSKAQILEVQDIETEELEIPEWGGSVFVRGMTGTERDQFETEQTIVTGRGKKRAATQDLTNFRARIAVYCCVDEHGANLFSKDDLPFLAAKSAAPLTRIAEVATRLSGLTEEDQEELVGNSKSAQSDDSGSA